MQSMLCYIRPIWLASVCARWRQIALAEPRLWSTINITYRREVPDLHRNSWTPPLELVQQWITRSGALPLHIVLGWEEAPESEDGALGEIIQILCEQCHRWRSLYIQVPPTAMLFFQAARSGSTIDLDYLSINLGDISDHPAMMGETILRPRHAALQSPPWVAGSYSWTNMVTLTISNANPYECLDIIQQAKQLESLNVVFIRTGEDEDILPPAEPVISARLREINIGFLTNGTLDEFFLNIRAPELESLELIRYADRGTHIPLDFLAPMLLQSGSGEKMRELTLAGMACSSEDLLDLLHGLSGLSQLTMLYHRAGDIPPPLNVLFDTLVATSSYFEDAANTVSFLPRLLAFSYRGPRTFLWSAIADILHAHNADIVDTLSKRPLESLVTLLVPSMVRDDYIDRETLVRLLALQPWSRAKLGLKEELFRASFEHHGMDCPLSPSSIPGHIVTYPWSY
ncbi:hypothetical protein D9619_002421 [Psilocybe cf. subviscida]|uniref:F-box domain-containing protein n=1 Tax=Psilocybe cf. subviscida TaxID=2480587 RepID=A0A8H5AWQ9_9AGAR|nr:hypothetical protein D9619_002421 [Psilocybe cf. subviscida]